MVPVGFYGPSHYLHRRPYGDGTYQVDRYFPRVCAQCSTSTSLAAFYVLTNKRDLRCERSVVRERINANFDQVYRISVYSFLHQVDSFGQYASRTVLPHSVEHLPVF
jgi:hypothetical protein